MKEAKDAGIDAFISSSQPRAASRVRTVLSRAKTSITSATPSGSNATSVKSTHSITYCVALGSVSEISLRASGMKPPGLASIAPAPTIAAAGDDATVLIFAIIPAALSGSAGRRSSRTANTSTSAPATTSTIATHVLGVELFDAAASPSTNAATTPTASVAPSAPA